MIRTVLVDLLVSPCIAAGMRAEDDYHDRHGMRIPVEGTVAPVRVGEVDWPENFRPVDADGWSTFRTTPDTCILYVSAGGDDASAVVYEPNSAAVGPDPFNPSGDIKPFRDVNAALKRQRPGCRTGSC